MSEYQVYANMKQIPLSGGLLESKAFYNTQFECGLAFYGVG